MATVRTLTATTVGRRLTLRSAPVGADAVDERPAQQHEMRVVWRNVVKFAVLHAVGLVGLCSLHRAQWATLAFGVVTYFISALGVTAGAHRLWTHRSYKARLPLRIFLAFANSMATENSLYVWCRDHRVHHKYSETDADPHNANRGFFFAHIGWLLVRKHPDVIAKGSKIDLSDLHADPVVMFQHRHYLKLTFLANLVIPTVVPALLWGESLWLAYLVAIVKYLGVLHGTWLVNSAAHMWGDRPYDVSINPAENKLVSMLAAGEGFHNYHHTFPHDYSTSEWRYSFNFTTFFIDCMAAVGQAYDRRTVSKATLEARMARTGPGGSGHTPEEEKDY